MARQFHIYRSTDESMSFICACEDEITAIKHALYLCEISEDHGYGRSFYIYDAPVYAEKDWDRERDESGKAIWCIDWINDRPFLSHNGPLKPKQTFDRCFE